MAHGRKHPFACRKLVALVAAALSGSPYAHNDSAAAASAQLLSLPITFERNDGQFPADVLFASRGRQGTLMVRAGEIAIAPRVELGVPLEPVRLRMLGANLAPEVEPQRTLATRSHYYNAKSPVENVPHFGELHVKDVYPGIDVALHGRDGVLEYDFVVSPGADPRDIRIDLRDVESAFIDGQGNLRFEHRGQMLAQRAPVAYQGDGGERRPVDAHFQIIEGLEGPEARIALGPYDAQSQLTVDPVISYSTYVGGSGTGGMALKVDPAGHVYYAYYDQAAATNVLNRLDPETNTLVYQTNFGPGTTFVYALALGGAGGNEAYVAGSTFAADFPVAGTPSGFDGYVAAFTPSGTFAGGARIAGVGGSGNEFQRALCLDGTGNVYVGGSTNAANFPVTGGITRNGSGSPTTTTDGYAIKFTSGFSTVYRRLLGGSGDEEVTGCVVDPAGQVIVAGYTSSTNFPTVGPPGSPPPPPGNTRAFVTKLAAADGVPMYSAYVGGSATMATAVALDPTTGDAIVVGQIGSGALVPASTRPYGGGSTDAYVLRLSASGTPLSGTLLGGAGFDYPGGVAVSGEGDIYVVGRTDSPDFPVVNPPPGGASLHGLAQDAFLTRLRGGAIDFSMFLGGSGGEYAAGVVPVAATGSVYVGGSTFSSDFPTVTPLRATRFNSFDGFITRISDPSGPSPPPPRLSNISTRMQVLTGDDVMIGGFVIGGSTTKRVAIVATGPSLAQFGIANPLANPMLRLVRSSDQATMAINDNWQSAANQADLVAAGFAPSNNLEAAILADLAPGAYTAIIEGAGGVTGVSVVGVYEVDHPENRLINISTRGRVLTGNDVMIGGFVITGPLSQRVAIVATGPSLAQFGIANPLANPTLRLVRSSDQAVIATNDDWHTAANAADLLALGFAPSNAVEAALLVTLPPGAYTAVVEGVAGGTGVAVVGVYAVN